MKEITLQAINRFRALHALAQRERGMTLIEVVVSLGIFMAIIGFLGGAYIATVNVQVEEIGMQRTISDVNNFYEIIDREIRTGYGHTYSTAGNFTFINQNKECVRYIRDGNVIKRLWNSNFVNCDDSAFSTGANFSSIDITSPHSKVHRLQFNAQIATVETRHDGEEVLAVNQGVVTVAIVACPASVVVVNSSDWRKSHQCIVSNTTVTARQDGVYKAP